MERSKLEYKRTIYKSVLNQKYDLSLHVDAAGNEVMKTAPLYVEKLADYALEPDNKHMLKVNLIIQQLNISIRLLLNYNIVDERHFRDIAWIWSHCISILSRY